MKKAIKLLFWPLSICVIAISFTSSYFISRATVENNSFSTGTWPAVAAVVINEIYYDVDPSHGNDGGAQNDEWLELYNNSNNAINLKDWTLTDNYETITIHADQSIPAYGFALLSKNANTWSYWGINPGNPGIGVEVISLGQFIGLSNSSDHIILKNDLGAIVDQMSYGTDTSIFLPACPDVAEGHSLERNPKGSDSDLALDFINQAAPTPGFGL